VFTAATASAAFPFVFAPVQVDARGPCVDGGIVNNTPIKEAIDANPEVDVVYVIAADPANMEIPPAGAAKLGGIHLGLRLAEMLIDERLVRDLAEAKAVNGWLDVLDRLQRENKIDAATRGEIIKGLYPRRRPDTFRKVAIIEIRPEKALEGTAFSAFFKAALRRSYIEDGWSAAERACADRDRRGVS
jgi:predicted acylesterase/phospholipase RssA